MQGSASLVKGPLSVTAPLAWLGAFRLEVQRAMDDGRCRWGSLAPPRPLPACPSSISVCVFVCVWQGHISEGVQGHHGAAVRVQGHR